MTTSCGKNSNSSNNKAASETSGNFKDNIIRIGFSIDTMAIERWQRDLDVFMNKVKELGAECIVQNAGNSIEEQCRQLMYLMECECDVIVVLPKEANSLKETIEKIRSKGIPVISYDRLVCDCQVDLYVSVDSRRVGEIMGEQVLERSSAESVYCILGPEEDYNMTLIRNGIRDSLMERGVEIAETFYTKGWNYDLSKQKALDLVTSGTIPQVIICGNDAVADSVISVLNTYYPNYHPLICGQDADIAACQNIVSGAQAFTVYKPITKLAEDAAQYAYELAIGKRVDELTQNVGSIFNGFTDIPVIWLEPEMVDASNIDAVIIDSGFHTKGEVYR